MKKLAVLLIVGVAFLAGCATHKVEEPLPRRTEGFYFQLETGPTRGYDTQTEPTDPDRLAWLERLLAGDCLLRGDRLIRVTRAGGFSQ